MRADTSGNMEVAPSGTALVEDMLVNHKSSLWVIFPFRGTDDRLLSYFDKSAIIRKSAEVDKHYLQEVHWIQMPAEQRLKHLLLFCFPDIVRLCRIEVSF